MSTNINVGHRAQLRDPGRSTAERRLGGAPWSWRRLALAVDVTMLTAATAFAWLASYLGDAPSSLFWIVVLPAITLPLLATRGLYRRRLQLRTFDDLLLILPVTVAAGMAIVTARALTGSDPAAAWQTVHQWLFTITYLVAGRTGLTLALGYARRRGDGAVPTLVLGAGRVGRLTARRFLERPELGLRPIAYLDDDPLPAATPSEDLPVLPESSDLRELIRRHGIGQVLVAFSAAPADVQLGLVRQCAAEGIPTAFVPRLFETHTEDIVVEHVGGLPLVSVRPSNPRGRGFAAKYAFDRVIAAVALVLVAPVLLGAALAVRISLGRPVLFRQVRVGLDGRTFEMLKFRTMRCDSRDDHDVLLPDDIAPGGGIESDTRVSRAGHILRRTAIDELPQLFNVLRGDMSLVGPRPERPEFVQRFEGGVYRYADRHRVKSGMTGWAQIAGFRGNTSLRDRVEWDNWYIENWSLWLDLKILLLTVGALWRSDRQSGPASASR